MLQSYNKEMKTASIMSHICGLIIYVLLPVF